MKKFISDDGNSMTISNVYVKVNGIKPKQTEITKEEQEKINQPEKWKTEIVGGKLKFTEIIKEKTAEEVAKEDLKAKLEAGTATDNDIKEGLKMLL